MTSTINDISKSEKKSYDIPEELQAIATKVFSHTRLSKEDGLLLLATPHSETVRLLADYVRKYQAGDIVYYATTLFIHPTNLCELSCPLCSFYAKPGWKSAWFLEPEEIIEKVATYLNQNLTEVHFVGGLWRDCTLDYYKKCFTGIKALNPNLHIKALTSVEYDFLAKLHGISVQEVFLQMMEWGLGSMPGGGAEILVEEVRQKIAPGKITTDEYLNVHKIAHTLGLSSNITMLFGHIEEAHHIIEHLMRVREVQDETSGFSTFVPLKYHEENNTLGKRKHLLRPKDIRRIYAVSRLMLDNIRNIKVLWNYTGVLEAQELLHWGGNDLASTAIEERIINMAGSKEKMTEEHIIESIIQAGRVPKKTHSGHVEN